jgi:hypothetical protein
MVHALSCAKAVSCMVRHAGMSKTMYHALTLRYVSCLDVGKAMVEYLKSHYRMFKEQIRNNVIGIDSLLHESEISCQVDPYSGKLYQLTTGGVCRQASVSLGMIVPRQTVVSWV